MSRDRVLSICLTLVALSVFLSPGGRELFVGDETKYAEVVREMRGGAVFLPTLEGTPFTHKPPLHFWMILPLTHIFGLYSTWSFALPSLLGFLATLWLMWRMEGPIAAFVCGTSLMMWGSAQTARMDVTFTLAISFAVYLIAQRKSMIAAGVALGIATLIKGPMAPVIVIVFLLIERLRTKTWIRGRWLLGVVAMIVIPLLWFVPAMLMGGGGYTREVLVKQTAGRAVGAWVHRSPLWFYVAHAPGDLFPWFVLAVIAIFAAYKRNDDRAKFYVSWILAVLMPYSLMSSKLDVYMMAMIPPVALVIARLFVIDDVWLRRAWIGNVCMIVVLLLLGIAGPFVKQAAPAKPVFIAMIVCSVLALILARNAQSSTLALGLAAIAPFVFAIIALMPMINEMASDRAMIRALVAQRIAPEQIALYTAPHVWTHDMPRELARVRYVSPETLRATPATVVVTSRAHSKEIAGILRGYRHVDTFNMIGKPFDVYRR